MKLLLPASLDNTGVAETLPSAASQSRDFLSEASSLAVKNRLEPARTMLAMAENDWPAAICVGTALTPVLDALAIDQRYFWEDVVK